ncbi:SAF domain-containing protein [Cutibacterium porci]|uniref:SAF domain-containing protein n=1 Tax=Cutibacterium porci TaxID=2605781 RepID=UPI002DDB0F55|nr:SAF domain-containing protein [Cutibacterium porci]
MVARHRRGLAAILAAIAVLLVASPATSASGREVVVAAHAIEGGRVIQPTDVRIVRIDPGILPHETASLAQVEGHQASVRITEGTILTTSAVLSGSAIGPGKALVGIHVADSSMVGMLQVGQRVSVVSPSEDGTPRILTRGAIIRSLPSSGGGLIQGSPSTELVVVSTGSADAAAIAVAGQGQPLGLVVE